MSANLIEISGDLKDFKLKIMVDNDKTNLFSAKNVAKNYFDLNGINGNVLNFEITLNSYTKSEAHKEFSVNLDELKSKSECLINEFSYFSSYISSFFSEKKLTIKKVERFYRMKDNLDLNDCNLENKIQSKIKQINDLLKKINDGSKRVNFQVPKNPEDFKIKIEQAIVKNAQDLDNSDAYKLIQKFDENLTNVITSIESKECEKLKVYLNDSFQKDVNIFLSQLKSNELFNSQDVVHDIRQIFETIKNFNLLMYDSVNRTMYFSFLINLYENTLRCFDIQTTTDACNSERVFNLAKLTQDLNKFTFKRSTGKVFFEYLKDVALCIINSKKQQIRDMITASDYAKNFDLIDSNELELVRVFSQAKIPQVTYIKLDGTANSIDSYTIDFGLITVDDDTDDQPVYHTLHLHNKTEHPINVSFIKLAGYDSIFDFKSVSLITLESKCESLIKIYLRKESLDFGLHTSSIQVDFENSSPIYLKLKAQTEKLDFEVQDNQIEFGNILNDKCFVYEKSLRIANKMNQSIFGEIKETKYSCPVTINFQKSFTIKPNSSEIVSIYIKSNDFVGSYENELKIIVNKIVKKCLVKANFVEPNVLFKNQDDNPILSSSSIEFPITEPNSTSVYAIKIINKENIKTTIKIELNECSVFKIKKSHITLLPYESKELEIIFNPKITYNQSYYTAVKFFYLNIEFKIHVYGRCNSIPSIIQRTVCKQINDCNLIQNGFVNIKDFYSLMVNKANYDILFKFKPNQSLLKVKPNLIYRLSQNCGNEKFPEFEYKLLRLDNEISTRFYLENLRFKNSHVPVDLRITVSKPTLVLDPIGVVDYGFLKPNEMSCKKIFVVSNKGETGLKFKISYDLKKGSTIQQVNILDKNKRVVSLNEIINVEKNRSNKYTIQVKTGEKHGFFRVDLELISSNDFDLNSFGEVIAKQRVVSLIGYISTKVQPSTKVNDFDWKSVNCSFDQELAENLILNESSNKLLNQTYIGLILSHILKHRNFNLEDFKDLRKIDSNEAFVEHLKQNSNNVDLEELEVKYESIKNDNRDQVTIIRRLSDLIACLVDSETLYVYKTLSNMPLVLNKNQLMSTLCKMLFNTLGNDNRFNTNSFISFIGELQKVYLNKKDGFSVNDLCNFSKILTNTDIFTCHYYEPFIKLAFNIDNLEENTGFYLKENSRYSQDFNKMFSFVQNSNVESLVSFMNENYRTFYYRILRNEFDDVTFTIINFLPDDDLKSNFEIFYKEMLNCKHEMTKITKNVFKLILDEPNHLDLITKLFDLFEFKETESVFALFDVMMNQHELKDTYEIIRKKFVNDQSEVNVTNKTFINSLNLLSSKKPKTLSSILKNLKTCFYFLHNPTFDNPLRRLDRIIDLLIDIFNSNEQKLLTRIPSLLFKFMAMTCNTLDPLANAMNQFLHTDSIKSSLNLMLQYSMVKKNEKFIRVFYHVNKVAEKYLTQLSESNALKFVIELNYTPDKCSLIFNFLDDLTDSIRNNQKFMKKPTDLENLIDFGNFINDLEPIFTRNETIVCLLHLIERLIQNSTKTLQIEKRQLERVDMNVILAITRSLNSILNIELKHLIKINDEFTSVIEWFVYLMLNLNEPIEKKSIILTFFIIGMFKLFSMISSCDLEEPVDTIQSESSFNTNLLDIVETIPFEIKSNEFIDENEEENLQLVRLLSNPNEIESHQDITEYQDISKDLSDKLEIVHDKIKFDGNLTLSCLDEQKYVQLIETIPNLRDCVRIWTRLFKFVSKQSKNKNDDEFQNLCISVFKSSINLYRFMYCVKICLSKLSTRPLREFNEDMNQVSMCLKSLATDKTVKSIFKKYDMLNDLDSVLNDSGFNEPMKIKLKETSLSKVPNLEENYSMSENVNEKVNEKEWFENVRRQVLNISEKVLDAFQTVHNDKIVINKRQVITNKQDTSLQKVLKNTKSSISKFSDLNLFTRDGDDEFYSTKSGVKINATTEMSISKNLLQGKLNKKNILEFYEKAQSQTSQTELVKLFDPTVAKPIGKIEKWTYQRLVESESLKKFIQSVTRQLRTKMEGVKYEQEFEWCIMVDNSGSMSFKETYVAEALVVVFEVLRILEHKFAVARFGSKFDDKCLLKKFDTPMSFSLGQQILESFTFNQGTFPINGIQNVSNSIWGTSKKSSNQHRIMLMITDGLTTQKELSDWKNLKSSYSLKLGIVLIKDKIDTYQDYLFKQIAENPNLCKVLDSDNSNKLTFEFLYVMIDMLDTLIDKLGKNTDVKAKKSSFDVQIPSFRDIHDNCDFEHILRSIGNSSYEKALKEGNERPNTMFTHNSCNDKVFNNVQIDDIVQIEVNVESIILGLDDFYSKLLEDKNFEAHLKDANKYWIEFENRLSKQIDDYTNALENFVFESNKFTRKRADLKGSSLYLPGLIKAVTSDFNYKKIFASKTTGAKRVHSLVIAIDVSYSMNGHMAECVIDVLLTFLFAMKKIEIENFSIVLFGETVKLIKHENQPFDASVLLVLISNLRFDKDYLTRDSEAIETAISLLKNSSINGSKKIFVFTDGYSSSRSTLISSLKKADNLDYETIGISIGFVKPGLQEVYKMFIHSALPFNFHEALQSFYENQESGTNFLKEEIYTETDIDDLKEILKDFKNNKVFSHIFNDLKQEREATLTQTSSSSNFTVDICFCLDSTGSMSPWFSGIKDQLLYLVDPKGLPALIKKNFPYIDVIFNVGVISFKDVSDGQEKYKVLNFTQDTNEFSKFLKELKPKGGGDLPEDIIEALKKSTNEFKWESKAKFIILITDAPPHGSEFSNLKDDFPNVSNSNTAKIVLKSIRDKNIEFMCVKLRKETDRMEQIFSSHYNDDNKKMSIVEVFTSAQMSEIENSFIHYIFLLDESGSMEGENWSNLITAYQSFLHDKMSYQNNSDKVSVVTYNNSSRVQLVGKSFIEAVNQAISFSGGGTNFTQAFQTIDRNNLINQVGGKPVILFMTDGCAEDPTSYVSIMMNKYSDLKIHSIIFGNDQTGKNILDKIAGVGKTGVCKMALTGQDLFNTFQSIGNENNQVLDQMVIKLSEIIGNELETKIQFEYL